MNKDKEIIKDKAITKLSKIMDNINDFGHNINEIMDNVTTLNSEDKKLKSVYSILEENVYKMFNLIKVL